jgi:hypothetical protein
LRAAVGGRVGWAQGHAAADEVQRRDRAAVRWRGGLSLHQRERLPGRRQQARRPRPLGDDAEAVHEVAERARRAGRRRVRQRSGAPLRGERVVRGAVGAAQVVGVVAVERVAPLLARVAGR